MIILICLACSCIFGFILFSKDQLNNQESAKDEGSKVSVIIPARNEEASLPFLLDSLMTQTVIPYEIIVIDDMSSDRTYEIAASYGVKVIRIKELPGNWTGKSWALWNGVRESSGDILVFFDTDVRLAPEALETLLRARAETGGAISVVPYHKTSEFYEKFSLIPYLHGVLAFTSPFERKSKRKGLSAVPSMSNLRPSTILSIAIWFAGLLAVEFIAPLTLIFSSKYAIPFVLGYILYTIQIFCFLKYSGDYGRVMPVLHMLSSAFFIVVMLYSYYQVAFTGSVTWKGRQVKIGRK